MKNYQFLHTMSTVYYCIPCVNEFKCKRESSEKERQQREDEFARTGEIPLCDLCNVNHWRCQNKKCRNCCRLRRCNDIICSRCKEKKIECKRTIPKTQAEFEILKDLGISYCKGQFESTEQHQFHEQFYFQFKEKERQTISSIKNRIFKYHAMNFPKYLNGDSDQNQAYSGKSWNRCKEKKHKKRCRCDFLVRENICDICDESCIMKRT